MTLEDLLAQFKAGFRERLHAPLPRPEGDEAIRAGIRAVVEALRDELTSVSRLRDVQRVFEEILASDGVEATAEDCSVVQYTGGMNDLSVSPVKAAGASARKDEGADGGSVILSDAAERIATPAAAPDDVCEWTQEGWEYRRTGCDGRSYHIYNPKYGRPGNKCPECKRPVHLKSEAAR